MNLIRFSGKVSLKFPTRPKIKGLTDKPIVLQEFGKPTTGEKWRREEDQEWKFKKILKWTMEEELSGVTFFGSEFIDCSFPPAMHLFTSRLEIQTSNQKWVGTKVG